MMLYVSYHNADLKQVTELLGLVDDISADFWFDRHQVHPLADWDSAIDDARRNADFALVFLSSNYTDTPYCIAELAWLETAHTKLIGIIIDDFNLSVVDSASAFVDMIDIRRHPDAVARQLMLKERLAAIDISMSQAPLLEKHIYLKNLISATELKLKHPTRGFIFTKPLKDGNPIDQIRPRGYIPQLLEQRSFKLVLDDDDLVVEELISLLDIQPNNIIHGQVNADVKSLLLLITLWSAHSHYVQNREQMPIYLDLVEWGPDDTFEEFIASQWQLVHDWRTWLANNSAFFIINTDDTTAVAHPDYLEQISRVCFEPVRHSVVMGTTQSIKLPSDTYSSAIIAIQPMSDALITQTAREYLPKRQVSKITQLYAPIEQDRHERLGDYLLCLMELLAVDTEMPLETFPIHLASHIAWYRWQKTISPVTIPIGFEEFLDSLKYLAWSMLHTETPYAISYGEALNHIGDSAILDIGLELELLEHLPHGNIIKFQMRLFQTDLASYILVKDGIYKHLRKPQFSTDLTRVPTKWDRVVLATFANTEPEQHIDILETISDIDPLLGIDFARQDEKLAHQYTYQLVDKVVDIRRKHPKAHRALVSKLDTLPDADLTAECLVRLMTNAPWSMQMLLHSLLSQLTYSISEGMLADVRAIDRGFSDAQVELVSSHTPTQWVVYLAHLLQHPDPTIQRNAISLAVYIDDTRLLPALFSLLNDQAKTVTSEAISSILSLTSTPYHLSRLLINIPEANAQPQLIATIFSKMGRDVSAALINKFYTPPTDDFRDVYVNLAQVNEETIKHIVAHQLTADEAGNASKMSQTEDKYAMKLSRLLMRRFRNVQDKSSLDSLLEDITHVNPIISDTAAGNQTNKLVDRVKASIVKADAQTENNSAESQIDSEVLEELTQAEWLVRYKALYKLAGYPSEQITPYLIRVAEDDKNIQVRMGAIEILASLPNNNTIQTALLNALQDPEPSVIDVAVQCIKKMEQFDTNRIVSMLKHPNLHTVAAAIDILSVHHDETAIDLLISMLDDTRQLLIEDEPIGFYAAKTLRLMNKPKTLSAVEKSNYLNPPSQTDVIPPAIERRDRITNYTLEQKVQLTIIALQGDDWNVSQKAGRYLRKLAKTLRGTNPTDVIALLENNLNNPTWTVRQVMLEALAWIQAPDSVGQIVPLLNDKHWMVIISALHALTELNAQSAAPIIATLLQHPNTAVCEAAAEALGLLRNPDVIDELHVATSSKDEFVRLAALQSIQQILGAEAKPYLVEMLHDPYNHIRWFAIKHLPSDLDVATINKIALLLPDHSGPAWEDETISDYAVQVLQASAEPHSKRILDQWIQESEQK